jgi:hypothetical protein
MIKKISLIGFASVLLLISCNKPKDNELPTGQYNYTKFVPAITDNVSASEATNYILVNHVSKGVTNFAITSQKLGDDNNSLPQELLVGMFKNDQIGRTGAKDCFVSTIKSGKYAGHTITLSSCNLHYFATKDEASNTKPYLRGLGLTTKYSIDTVPVTVGKVCIDNAEGQYDQCASDK